jgi:molecular chaperone DnaK
MYALGIDLGTTFTAAATWRHGHAETATLGSRQAAIPSVVLLREDETFLTGEAANRRGLTEPHRVAREFKRRLGDTTPILLGGVPYSAEALMARLLRSVVDDVASREGGLASKVCVSHPANWGPYKTDLLLQAVRLAGLEEPVSFTTEPEAAAVFYAHQNRIEPGAVVAVYDLGGGTFDAAVLRKTAVGFEILGRPEGIERLGGVDFDAAVFSHVTRALGGKLAELDEDDPSVIAAVGRLRDECVEAKEALSSDTDVSIPVLLPTVSTEVRLTRSELEAMVRPALYNSVEALKRALRSAGVTADRLHSVLLVGGSSRMPIVAQLVGAELGRSVAVDAHPKHAVALGGAWLASGALSSPAPPRAVSGSASVAAAVAAVPIPAPPISAPPFPAPPFPAPVGAVSAPSGTRTSSPVPVGTASAPTQVVAGPGASQAGPPPQFVPPEKKRGLAGQRGLMLAAAAAVVVLAAGGGIAIAVASSDRGTEPLTAVTSAPTDSVPAASESVASTAAQDPNSAAGGGGGGGANSQVYPKDARSYGFELLKAWAKSDYARLGQLATQSAVQQVKDSVSSGGVPNSQWISIQCTPNNASNTTSCVFRNAHGDETVVKLSNSQLGFATAVTEAPLDRTVYPNDPRQYAENLLQAHSDGNQQRVLRLSNDSVKSRLSCTFGHQTSMTSMDGMYAKVTVSGLGVHLGKKYDFRVLVSPGGKPNAVVAVLSSVC